jgi:hypothetical protein
LIPLSCWALIASGEQQLVLACYRSIGALPVTNLPLFTISWPAADRYRRR